MSLPYERIIQWVAGPFAVGVGVVSTKLVANLGWLGQLGLQKSAVAHGIVAGVVFVVSAGVTYAAHHKWLDNLSKWWTVKPTVASTSPAPAVTTSEKLRAQLVAAGHTPEA